MNRDFKGVWIPKEIWLNKDLSVMEKCLLTEIDSLDNDEEMGCYASNKYLAEFFNISEGRLANIIVDLKKRNYVSQIFFNGKERGLRVHENVKAGITKSLKQPSRKREHINTAYKNKHNNTPIIAAIDYDALRLRAAAEIKIYDSNLGDFIVDRLSCELAAKYRDKQINNFSALAIAFVKEYYKEKNKLNGKGNSAYRADIAEDADLHF